MIYLFILELEEIKIKLSSEHYNEYIVAIRKNKKLRQWIIILMIAIQGIIVVIKILEQLIGTFDNLMVSNITEVVLKVIAMIVLFYMIYMFVRLAYFIKNKKEEKMTKFQRHTHSYRHSKIMFFCIFLAILNFVDSVLSFFTPIDQLINPE